MMFPFSSLQNICSLECIIAYIVCGWVVTVPSYLLQSHSLQLFRTCIIFVSNFFQNFKYIFSLTWIYFIYFHLDIFHIFSPECISYIFTWIYFIYFHLDIFHIFSLGYISHISPGSLKRLASCQHLATWSAKCFHQLGTLS